MEDEPPICECCECKHFMLLCGMGSWCYKFHRRTSSGGTCEHADRVIYEDEKAARFIDGYEAEQQSAICP